MRNREMGKLSGLGWAGLGEESAKAVGSPGILLVLKTAWGFLEMLSRSTLLVDSFDCLL